MRPIAVAWLCVASVVTEASTANPAHTTTAVVSAPAVGQHGLEVSSENTGIDSENTGRQCFDGGDKGGDRCDHGEQVSDDQLAWTSVGDAVDLGELADRVSDALVTAVGVDGSTSSSPGLTPPGHSAQANSTLSNQGEQESGDFQEEGVVESAQRDAARHEEAMEMEMGLGETCGEGEHQRVCKQDEECCNSSCGICAPKGHSCLRIACGVLSRGGGTKTGLESTGPSSQQSRLRRQKALVTSVKTDESMPLKDRFQHLQLHMPELFEHVSLNGFKRLMAQVTGKGASATNGVAAAEPRVDHTKGLSTETQVETSTASAEKSASEQAVDQGKKKVGLQQEVARERSITTQRSQGVKKNNDAHDSNHPSTKSLPQPKHGGAREQNQRAEERVKAITSERVPSPSSSTLRSSLDGTKATRAGGDGPAGGRDETQRKPDAPATTTMKGRHQQRRRGAEGSRADPHHPKRAGIAHGGQESSTSAPPPSESDRLLPEHPSVWEVGQSVTGLADVDTVSTMNGLLHREISEEMKDESDRLGRERAAVLQAAMGRLWKGYSDHAWGDDEVKPLGKRGTNNWGGMGVTLVDSLDTLWLMGLTEEFYSGRDWVRDHMTFDNAGMVSVFETTIRVLGGLLSAFELSREKVFLNRAKELADKLLPAFASSTGIPYKSVNLSTGKVGGAGNSVLSELGTLQLEFRYLSRELGDSTYADKAMRAFEFLAEKPVSHGLYPIKINPSTGEFISSQVTVGALGDSFYEYLLKVWIQGGRKEDKYRQMYDDAMDGVDELLVQKTRGLTYLSEWNGSARQPQHRMDHLACFMAGNLALGSITSQDPVRAARDLKTGKALAYTCHQMYMMTATGLSPETVDFTGPRGMRARAKARFYILRPETLESFFVLHQLTGDPVYREWGWNIFRAIELYCRIGVGYGSHPDVENPTQEPRDHMESFFPGETLKYLYLLMQPDHRIDLMKYTFNTEAHPLKVFPFDGSRDSQILS